MSSGGRPQVEFDGWYAVERPRLVAVLLRTGHPKEEAEEIADEAMARALARWRRVSEMASPVGWTTVVAFNLSRRRGARRSKERALLTASNHGVRSIRDHADGADPDLWAAVSALPNRQRTMVVLRYVHDLTEPEIATLLKIRRGTVASGLHDARRSLAVSLGSSTVEPEATRSEPAAEPQASEIASIKEVS